MQVTANQLAKQLGVEYVVAASLLKLAVSTGQGEEAGKLKTSLTGKGKPSTVYEVPDVLTISLTASAPVSEPLTLPQEPQSEAA
jgi:hypothetical protein